MALPEDEFPNIVSDIGVLAGKHRIKGTRLSVAFILELVASGGTIDDIVREYPHVSRESVMEALRYAAHFFRDEVVVSAAIPASA